MASFSGKPQKPLSATLDAIALLLLAVLGMVGLYVFRHAGSFSRWDVFALISLGSIGICRWTWFIVRVVRSRIYLHWVFPRWRHKANEISVTDLPHTCFLVPTYNEQPWITERVFRAIVQEAKTLAQPITLLVNSSSDQENAAIQAILQAEDPGYPRYIRLIQMTQREGKRKAMADALRQLAKLNLSPDTIIALMDGDSELTPGTLGRCLPFFRLFPRMGGLTTDELPIVKGSYLFSEWFYLRFAQRHYQMCSDSLSRKVMCLTGRFSLFRAEAALHPSFAQQLENDTLDDWLWGQFKFLSGDDKSTWFWLLRHGYDMLYIPDALVYSVETLSGSVIDRAYQNMRRWYGNMLRNSGRAIALGPYEIGWFTWYSLIDQRISIWTSLLTPGFLVISLLQGNLPATVLILSWVLFSRTLMLWIIFWGRNSYLKLIHFPILLITQWTSSLVKIWTQMNLARQSWTNRGIQNISAEGSGRERVLKLGASRWLLFCQLFAFGVVLCWLSGLLSPAWDLAGLWLNYDTANRPPTLVVEVGGTLGEKQQSVTEIERAASRIIPNDGRDDAKALQALIDQLPPDDYIQVRLPIGEIDLFSPLEISRSHLIFQGQGVARTILRSHLQPSAGDAVLIVRPKQSEAIAQTTSPASVAHQPPTQPSLRNVELSNFSLQQAETFQEKATQSSPDGILLDNVADSSVKYLALEQWINHSLVLRRTQDIAVEYISFGDSPQPGGMLLQDAKNTQTKGFFPS